MATGEPVATAHELASDSSEADLCNRPVLAGKGRSTQIDEKLIRAKPTGKGRFVR